ncbi:SEC-C metal-binding domain-containing protein [Vibrio parahaemolyticus]|uniref:SEC-C metal-binding domain-containing protein n=1 Tax=Vibrio mediterranei TaxID=689 RepID=UPI0040685F15
MKFIELPADWAGESSAFIEGAILAANFAAEPLKPEAWLSSVLGDFTPEQETWVVEHLHAQYALLKTNQYALLALLDDNQDLLADFAEGFMTVWPVVEIQWQGKALSDGTERMLQALLTTLMLAMDEEQTHAQMREAGFEQLPTYADLAPQLDTMVHEVAMAADEMMIGHQSQTVNPFKAIGRNDPCPCGSGSKFKKCCGK